MSDLWSDEDDDDDVPNWMDKRTRLRANDEIVSASLSLSQNDVREWWKTEFLTDFSIISGDGRKFMAHRLVLAAHSGYIKTLLSSEYVESSSNSVTLEDVTSEV